VSPGAYQRDWMLVSFAYVMWEAQRIPVIISPAEVHAGKKYLGSMQVKVEVHPGKISKVPPRLLAG